MLGDSSPPLSTQGALNVLSILLCLGSLLRATSRARALSRTAGEVNLLRANHRGLTQRLRDAAGTLRESMSINSLRGSLSLAQSAQPSRTNSPPHRPTAPSLSLPSGASSGAAAGGGGAVPFAPLPQSLMGSASAAGDGGGGGDSGFESSVEPLLNGGGANSLHQTGEAEEGVGLAATLRRMEEAVGGRAASAAAPTASPEAEERAGDGVEERAGGGGARLPMSSDELRTSFEDGEGELGDGTARWLANLHSEFPFLRTHSESYSGVGGGAAAAADGVAACDVSGSGGAGSAVSGAGATGGGGGGAGGGGGGGGVGVAGDPVAETLLAAREWARLPFVWRVRRLLSFYITLDLSANTLLLVYAARMCDEQADDEYEIDFAPPVRGHDAYNVCGAVGIFCCWVGLMRYFEHSRRLFFFSVTLRRAAAPCLWLCLAILPVFIGYALAGVLCFSAIAPNFADFATATTTLWSNAFGDELNETFRQVQRCAEDPSTALFLRVPICTHAAHHTTLATHALWALHVASVPFLITCVCRSRRRRCWVVSTSTASRACSTSPSQTSS